MAKKSKDSKEAEDISYFENPTTAAALIHSIFWWFIHLAAQKSQVQNIPVSFKQTSRNNGKFIKILHICYVSVTKSLISLICNFMIPIFWTCRLKMHRGLYFTWIYCRILFLSCHIMQFPVTSSGPQRWVEHKLCRFLVEFLWKMGPFVLCEKTAHCPRTNPSVSWKMSDVYNQGQGQEISYAWSKQQLHAFTSWPSLTFIHREQHSINQHLLLTSSAHSWSYSFL